MTPRDWFILVLRGFGIWQLVDVVEYAGITYSIYAGTYRPRDMSWQFYFLATGMHFLLAVWLLYFAPATSRLFYPADHQRTSRSDSKNTPTDT
jgi:hypothetical protein